MKLNENSELYKAQLKISAITYIKPNALESDYGADHLKFRSLAMKSWAHSRIRDFNWLLASHALPVATRMRGIDSCNTCKCCGKADETIRHMAYGCKWAKDVRNIVFTKWWGRTVDSSLGTQPSFRRSLLCTITKRESSMDTMRRTLNHITSRALLGSVASDPTFYSGGTGSSPVSGDGFSERFPLSRLYWYQGLRQV